MSLLSYQDWTTVMCQRLFGGCDQSFYFAVHPPAETKRRMLECKADVEGYSDPDAKKPTTKEAVRAELFGQLAIHRGQSQAGDRIVAREVDKTEDSPWLDTTASLRNTRHYVALVNNNLLLIKVRDTIVVPSGILDRKYRLNFDAPSSINAKLQPSILPLLPTVQMR
jgi:hypothetical protein